MSHIVLSCSCMLLRNVSSACHRLTTCCLAFTVHLVQEVIVRRIGHTVILFADVVDVQVEGKTAREKWRCPVSELWKVRQERC